MRQSICILTATLAIMIALSGGTNVPATGGNLSGAGHHAPSGLDPTLVEGVDAWALSDSSPASVDPDAARSTIGGIGGGLSLRRDATTTGWAPEHIEVYA